MIRVRSSVHADRAILWIAVILVMCMSYYLTFLRFGAAVDAQQNAIAQRTDLMRADDAFIAQRPQLERDARTAEQDVRRFGVQDDRPTTVARFIRLATSIVSGRHAIIEQIDERPPEIAPPGSTLTIPVQPFEPIALDVTLAGSYTDLLATIRALARGPLAMQIEVGSIERSSAESGVLLAHVHVILQRLADPQPAPTPVEARHA